MRKRRGYTWGVVTVLMMLLTLPAGAWAARPITIAGDELTDLAFLEGLLEGKRIVLLGESNHGAREFTLQKNRLIRYLHEKLGYNVLLLESGIGEVYALEYRRDELSERQMLNGLIGPWRTLEYVELMKYLKRDPALAVGGYDVQRSGRAFGAVLKQVRALLGSAESARFEGLEERYSAILPKLKDRRTLSEEQLNELLAEGGKLVEDYATTRTELEENATHALENGWSARRWSVVQRTLQNRIEFLGFYAMFKVKPDYRERWAARDAVMADNVRFFAKEIYPGQKIIVSGHNFHVARHNDKEEVMGEALAKSFGDAIYVVGMFAGRGSFADNSREPQALDEPTDPRDLAHRMRALRWPSTFLEIPHEPTSVTKWLFDDVVVGNTFLDLDEGNTLNLSRALDGLILIREISPSRFPPN